MIILFLKYREKHRYRRCLIGVFVGLGIAAAVILAGLLPALIINSTRSSTTNETDSATNTGQFLFNKSLNSNNVKLL